MPVIKAQKIPKEVIAPEDILARFCYYFPQYTFAMAKRMPYKRIGQMMSIVRKEQALNYLQLTRIASAPHTSKGSGVKKLIQSYQDILKG
jgi:hypothetical protein